LKIRYKIRDNQDERTVAKNGFPIIIGASPTADIRVTGLTTDEDVAYIGISRNRPFLQVGPSGVPVQYNHRILDNSSWLMHGDRIDIASCQIHIRVEGNHFIIEVIRPDSGVGSARQPATKLASQTQKIRPLAFRPTRRRQSTDSLIRYRRFIAMAIGLGFLLLIIAAWFVFTARQIMIQIEPRPDQISISGSLVAPRFGGRYLLRPGSYTLYATRECYHALEQPFEVGTDKNQTVRFEMERLPGRISLQAHKSGDPTTPVDGARVIIDGLESGTTPISNLEVKAGLRVLEIQMDNYQDIKTEMQITGCPEEQSLDFALIPGWSDVFISSIPEGAAVSVGSEPAGNTPVKIELPEGNHRLQISGEGFKTWETQLSVKPNQPQTIKDIRLEPASGTLAVQTQPAGANVTIGQKFVGTTPLKIPLSANTEHEIRISKAGHENVSRRVRVDSGKLKSLRVDLKPVWGVIRFTVAPADAQLVVDGKNQGTVPQELKLVAVSHQVEIVKKGYKPYRTRLTPRPGYPQEIKITLSSLKSKPTGLADVIAAQNGYTLKMIRPGPFTMGSSRRERSRRPNETLRNINLRRSFYIGIREVTNKEFKEFLAGHNSGRFNGQKLNQDNQPVVQVTWEQAALFCNWLSAKESLSPVYVKKGDRLVAAEPIGTGYRLPTEAEWEYCARFTKNQVALKYPWGNQFPPTSSSGNYADASARKLLAAHIENYNDGYPVTAPPAKFNANDLGLYDLGGNVAEWCHDFYTIYTYNNSKTDIDPSGAREGKHHVIRGAGWKDSGINRLRLAYRDYGKVKGEDLGFRIGRYIE
jgi:formylglycine-generating enzyme required for sulfatase activity